MPPFLLPAAISITLSDGNKKNLKTPSRAGQDLIPDFPEGGIFKTENRPRMCYVLSCRFFCFQLFKLCRNALSCEFSGGDCPAVVRA